MAIRLVRESSETPNITNKDDTKMIRYAYGGYDGVVKDYGSELSYAFNGSTIHIGSGRIVLQGWEVDIDEFGVDIDIDYSIGTRYYTIYLEINLITEKAEIKSMYGTGDYPDIDSGDDLTQFPTGTARMELYSAVANNNELLSVEPLFKLIKYNSDLFEDLSSGDLIVGRAYQDETGKNINERFEALEEFMTQTYYGNATLINDKYGRTLNSSSVQKLGNSVVLVLNFNKGGLLELDKDTHVEYTVFSVSVPREFRPKATILSVPDIVVNYSIGNAVCSISPDGTITYITGDKQKAISSTSKVFVHIPAVLTIRYTV